MAYMSQEKKAELAPGIKAVLKKYGMKGTIGVHHNSTLVVNIKSGVLDILTPYNKILREMEERQGYTNWQDRKNLDLGYGFFEEKELPENIQAFLKELREACNVGNWDKSDIQTDYFNVGWYVDINLGQWDKPFILEK